MVLERNRENLGTWILKKGNVTLPLILLSLPLWVPCASNISWNHLFVYSVVSTEVIAINCVILLTFNHYICVKIHAQKSGKNLAFRKNENLIRLVFSLMVRFLFTVYLSFTIIIIIIIIKHLYLQLIDLSWQGASILVVVQVLLCSLPPRERLC